MRILLSTLVTCLLLYSCNTQGLTLNEDQPPTKDVEDQELIWGINYDTRISILIVDEDYNDRLNPQSPSYFGKEYIDGITRSYLYEGKIRIGRFEGYRPKFPGSYEYVSDLFPGVVMYAETIENYSVVLDPSWETMNYYYIPCDDGFGFFEDNEIVYYSWICYPDGSEDELKVQIFENETSSIIQIGKLWVNNELAFDMGTWNGPEKGFAGDFYWNPKYYPWMIPSYDNLGNLLGMFPKGYRNCVLITK